MDKIKQPREARRAGSLTIEPDGSWGTCTELWAIELPPGDYPFYLLPESITAVLAEIERAVRKFPTWPTDPLHAFAVLGEEVGELQKAVLQCTYEPHKSTRDDVRMEAIQVAAMALRFLSSLNRYEYWRSTQHEQAKVTGA